MTQLRVSRGLGGRDRVHRGRGVGSAGFVTGRTLPDLDV
jgi:hypothetical protein